MHCFELKTTNLEYYVGGGESNLSVEINIENSSDSAWTKKSEEKIWESTIQHALMPVPSNTTS